MKVIGEDISGVKGVWHAPKNVRRSGASGYLWMTKARTAYNP